MKKISEILLFAAVAASAMFAFCACNDDDNYADRRKRERKTVQSFLKHGTLQLSTTGDTLLYVPPVKVISEDVFNAQDSTTDVSQNEYVYMKTSGVYMQIVRKGVGAKLQNGENATVLARYTEVNLRGDSIQTSNDNLFYAAVPDVMTVENTYGTFTASFISGVMYAAYGGSVPRGWLTPFSYIRIGRQQTADGQIAKVRLVVPSEQGQRDASGEVYACFYEITFQRGY